MGGQDLVEDCLLMRARAGDRQADIEVSARAMAGSFRCQVGLLYALGSALCAGSISAVHYLEHAEVLARMSAATGDWAERRRLACLLDLKALELRSRGADNASKMAHIECAILLTRLADEGDDDAMGLLNNLSGGMHADSLAVANMGMKALAATPKPPAQPVQEDPSPEASVAEQLASILGSEFEPTRRERLVWWFSDLWWGVRFWAGELAWRVRTFWWSVQDRVAALRERAE
jgi:hypothetical protein